MRSCGFQPGHGTHDVTAHLRAILQYATTWGFPVFVASQDIATFFDTIDHAELAAGLKTRGLPSQLIHAVMREVSYMTGTISLDGAG